MLSDLKNISNQLRIKIIKIVYKVKKGHIGGSFSCLDILVCLYISKIFNFSKLDFKKKINDFFILSKGHSAVALYSVLDYLEISKNFKLDNFHKAGGLLMEHPSPNKKLPGIEIETGSLGNGLGVGSGIAFANIKKNKKVIILVGDGELYEGSNWEAMLLASHFKLYNLLLVVDRNFSITLDNTENIMKLENLKKKIKAFGFDTSIIDGHNYLKIIKELKKFKLKKKGNPTFIICKTKKGKGSITLESDLKFHHSFPSKFEYKNILNDLGDIT
jgi:transketolase